MKETQYQQLLKWCRSHPTKEKILTILCQYSPISVIIIYTIMILWLFLNQDPRIMTIIIYPFITLLIITIMRKIFNKPRPSDIYDIQPLVKHHHGESFPSRHTASAVIIAYSCLYISMPLGILCFFIALYVGISRIVAGVHFVRDVLCATLISSLFGLLMFILK